MTKSERRAAQVLEEANIVEPPVDVEWLAKEILGVELWYEHLEAGVSGMLYREDRRNAIAVNSDHAEVRQRFTIAHELGHLLLHKGRPIIVDHLVRARLNLRDVESSLATNHEEIEANGFGAALLMPAEWIFRDVDERLPMASGRLVGELSAIYRVSAQAMENRLINLGIRAAQ